MKKEINNYVQSCDQCQKTKISNKKTIGLLQPHAVPERPWDCVSLDLITQLPKTTTGYDCIVVMVDKLTKMTYYHPTTTTVNAVDLANIFINRIIRLHGFPSKIITDRDPRFTSNFWKSFWQQTKTKLNISSAYHPETDGQTERQNRTLEQMLRSYVNPFHSDWDQHLAALEMAFNNSNHSSTGFSPFYLNSGQNPNYPIDLVTRPQLIIDNPTATERLQQLFSDIEQAKQNIQTAQTNQAKYANQHRREVKFVTGDKVLLSRENIKKNIKEQTPKLSPCWIGPYEIKKVLSDVSYELKLPTNLKIHPVVHVSRLKPYVDGKEEFPDREVINNQPTPTINHDGVGEWEVEEILDKKVQRRNRKEVVYYFVKWKGFDIMESTWEPISNLSKATESIQTFERK